MNKHQKWLLAILVIPFLLACQNANVSVTGLKTSPGAAQTQLPPGFQVTAGKAQITNSTYTTYAKVVGSGDGHVTNGSYNVRAEVAR